jgi:hypothetical protein
LIRKIADEAKAQGLRWESIRDTGGHEVFSLDGLRIPIARHAEIDDNLARIVLAGMRSQVGERMPAVPTYEVEVERGTRYWLVHVPAIARTTQARHLREVETMARDLISAMTERPLRTIRVNITYTLPAQAQKHLDEMHRLRDLAADYTRQANEHQVQAARTLTDDGIPLRDAGLLLDGISHQRVSQLLTGHR